MVNLLYNIYIFVRIQHFCTSFSTQIHSSIHQYSSKTDRLTLSIVDKNFGRQYYRNIFLYSPEKKDMILRRQSAWNARPCFLGSWDNYRIRSNYHTYPYKRTLMKFRSLITASVLFIYFFYKGICCGFSFELHRLVNAIQMRTHNICLYKENQKKNRIIIIK